MVGLCFEGGPLRQIDCVLLLAGAKGSSNHKAAQKSQRISFLSPSMGKSTARFLRVASSIVAPNSIGFSIASQSLNEPRSDTGCKPCIGFRPHAQRPQPDSLVRTGSCNDLRAANSAVAFLHVRKRNRPFR